MRHNYKLKRENKYCNDFFQATLQAVKDGETISVTVNQFNIPQTILTDKFQGNYQIHFIGSQTIFSKKQEEEHVEKLN